MTGSLAARVGCTTCGADDCLEDVIVKEPTPIRVHPLNCRFADYASNVLPMRDWDAATDTQRLEFLTALVRAKDLVSEVPPEMSSGGEGDGVRALVEEVRGYLADGGTIRDIAADLGLPWGLVKLGLGNGDYRAVVWRMTPAELIEFDEALANGTASIRALAERFRISSTTAQKLAQTLRPGRQKSRAVK